MCPKQYLLVMISQFTEEIARAWNSLCSPGAIWLTHLRTTFIWGPARGWSFSCPFYGSSTVSLSDNREQKPGLASESKQQCQASCSLSQFLMRKLCVHVCLKASFEIIYFISRCVFKFDRSSNAQLRGQVSWEKAVNLLDNHSLQFTSVAQLCPTLWDPKDCSTPGLPVHHQLLEFTQTHVHWVGDAIQPSHPLSSLL